MSIHVPSALTVQRRHLAAAEKARAVALGALQAARYRRDNPKSISPSPEELAQLMDAAAKACAKRERAQRVYDFLAGA